MIILPIPPQIYLESTLFFLSLPTPLMVFFSPHQDHFVLFKYWSSEHPLECALGIAATLLEKTNSPILMATKA